MIRKMKAKERLIQSVKFVDDDISIIECILLHSQADLIEEVDVEKITFNYKKNKVDSSYIRYRKDGIRYSFIISVGECMVCEQGEKPLVMSEEDLEERFEYL